MASILVRDSSWLMLFCQAIEVIWFFCCCCMFLWCFADQYQVSELLARARHDYTCSHLIYRAADVRASVSFSQHACFYCVLGRWHLMNWKNVIVALKKSFILEYLLKCLLDITPVLRKQKRLVDTLQTPWNAWNFLLSS